MLKRSTKKMTYDTLQEAAFDAARTMPAMYKQTLAIAPLVLVVPLFSIARDCDDEINVVWSKKGRGHLRYRGPRLTQSHQTVLFTLANLRAGEVVSNAFDFSPYELLTAMGWSTNGRNVARLREMLDDLKDGSVRLWNDGEIEDKEALRINFVSTFKPSDKGAWHVTLSEDLLPLFAVKNLTQINLPKRGALQEGLGTFLYAFIRAESCMLPFTYKEILEASGSEAKILKNFGIEVKRVLQGLKTAGLIQDFRIERGGFRVLK